MSLLAASGCAADGTMGDAGPDARVIMNEDTGPPACIMPSTPSPPAGPCRCNADCMTGAVCQLEDAFGSPMGRCVTACVTTANCPTGSVCTRDQQCVATCTAAGQCAPGRYCFSGHCTPLCASDADCFSGHCDAYTARCTPQVTMPTGGRTGETCLVDADCRSNICLSGVCATPCVWTHPNCPENEGCITLSPSATIEGGLCYQRCDGGVACRDPSTTCQTSSDLHGQFCF